MVSWDYFVGFEREPEGLNSFLDKQGYDRIPDDLNDGSRLYESKAGDLVDLCYYPAELEVDEEDVPNWKRNGYNVFFELMISTKYASADIEATRIADETAKEYGGIIYDPQLDDFSRSR